MTDNVIHLFAGKSLTASLEHALQMAQAGELSAVVLIGVDGAGDYTIGGMAGEINKLPVMSIIGELEHQKHLLLERIER